MFVLQLVQYLEAYVDHFGFRNRIIFRTEVTYVRAFEDGSFVVHTKVQRSCPADDVALTP
jgi:cation diffusion facilitator CzcD-associated flavoprotein CzcO